MCAVRQGDEEIALITTLVDILFCECQVIAIHRKVCRVVEVREVRRDGPNIILAEIQTDGAVNRREVHRVHQRLTKSCNIRWILLRVEGYPQLAVVGAFVDQVLRGIVTGRISTFQSLDL